MKSITEDYLIKLKLPKRVVLTGSIPYNEYSIRDNFGVYCYLDRSGNCVFYKKRVQYGDFFLVKCLAVDKFKKIVKVLTSKELVNETIKA